ncbi:MAG: PBP1A family penicillin-binding protein [Oligoflexales bacterium]|nr:PBP1A family penicillin-binding protein [Oligoflexales bacterium]
MSSPSNPNGKTKFHLILRSISLVLLVVILSSFVFLYLFLRELSVLGTDGSELTSLLNWKKKGNTLVYDRQGQPIAELFSQDHLVYTFESLPKPLVEAVISIEDRSFWQHPGFDLKGIFRAAFVQISRQGESYQQGGSTITQQVVRAFLLPSEKTLIRKVKEIFLAIKLERNLSKEKIFEIYVNSLFLGNGAYGVGAAAKRYFGKELTQLEIHEIALIAGLFQAPSLYNPAKHPDRARARQVKVLSAMLKSGFLNKEDFLSWVKKPLNYQTYNPWARKQAPYFTDFVIEEAKRILASRSLKNQGLKIYTTLDSTLQMYAEEAVSENSALFEEISKVSQTLPENYRDSRSPSYSVEAALLAADPKSGEILAMVGGRDYKSSQFNRTSKALRQPGSSFKPIIYSLALSQGFRWSDVFTVTPLNLGGGYRPRNNEADYLTETTLLRAFYRSMNSPTLQLSEKIGILPIIQHARRLGIHTPVRMEWGSVLGSSETSMLDMVRTYSVFANEGKKLGNGPFAITEIRDFEDQQIYSRKDPLAAEAVLSPQVAYLMIEGMRQVLIRGSGVRAAQIHPWAVGKTGTTNESKDNWFNGFSTRIVASVWVGSDAFLPLDGHADGSRLALPVWMNFMTKASQIRKPESFKVPEGVESFSIDPNLGFIKAEGGIDAWFLKSNPPPKNEEWEKDLDGLSHENFRNPF